MTDPGLLQALDYILNQSNESTIEVLAEAVVRRRRNISIFGAIGNIPDPQKMAKELTDKIDLGINSGIEGMRNSIREMMLRIIKEHAPELTITQIDELVRAWMPAENSAAGEDSNMPPDMLLSMIEQFISFSHGTMNKKADEELRKELGDWPGRYWKAFPSVVRGFISDYLKDIITEKEFKSRIAIALGLQAF